MTLKLRKILQTAAIVTLVMSFMVQGTFAELGEIDEGLCVGSSTMSFHALAEAKVPSPVEMKLRDVTKAVDLSSIAYHAYDANSASHSKRERFQRDRKLLEQNGYEDLTIIEGETGAGWFTQKSNVGIAVRKGKTLHIAFRGTKFTSLADLITDARFLRENCLGLGQVHTGVNRAFESFREQISQIMARQALAGVNRIKIAGHSLGGALAQRTAVHLAHKTKQADVQLSTFNAPRIGDSQFAKTSNRLLGKEKHARFVKGRDILGSAVNLGLFGNKHAGTEIRLEEQGYNPVRQHSLDSFRDGRAEEGLRKFNEKPQKFEGFKTRVRKSVQSAREWVVDKASKAKEFVVEGCKKVRNKFRSRRTSRR